MIKGYTTVAEISDKWGVKPRTVQIMCAEGRIKVQQNSEGHGRYQQTLISPQTIEWLQESIRIGGMAKQIMRNSFYERTEI